MSHLGFESQNRKPKLLLGRKKYGRKVYKANFTEKTKIAKYD